MKKIALSLALTLATPITRAMTPNAQATQESYDSQEENWDEAEHAHAAESWGEWANADSDPDHEEEPVPTPLPMPRPEELSPEEQQAHAKRQAALRQFQERVLDHLTLDTPDSFNTQQATQPVSAQEEEGIPNALKEPMAVAVPVTSICHASAEQRSWNFQKSAAAADQETHVAYDPRLSTPYDPSLSTAVNFNRLSDTRTLLEQKADPNSVLDLAVHRKKQAIVELLLEYKANPATVTTSSRYLTTSEIKALLDAARIQSSAIKHNRNYPHTATPQDSARAASQPQSQNYTMQERSEPKESAGRISIEFHSFKVCIEAPLCESNLYKTFIPCPLDNIEHSPEYWDNPEPKLDRLGDAIDLSNASK